MTQRHPVAGNTWQMVSLPRQLPVLEYKASLVLSDFNYWLFHWHEGTGGIAGNYINYLNREFRQGLSYWLKTDSAGILELSNSWHDTTQLFSVLLEEGWNQIANPYGFDILWDDAYYWIEDSAKVTVKESPKHGRPKGIWVWDLDTNNYVRYDPQKRKAVMQTWQGYWVLAEEQTRIYLDPVPYFAMDDDTTLGPTKPAAVPADRWQVQLTAEQAGVKDPSNYCGMAPDASDGVESEDCPEPPPITPALSLAFKGNLSQDIRRSGPAAAWYFDVTGQEPGPVTLRWYQVTRVAPAYQLWLQDRTTGTWTDLRTAHQYSYSARAGNRQFQLVTVEDPGFSPDQVTLNLVILAADPNPFTDRTRITFSLPGAALDATPVLEVYNSRGAEITSQAGTVCRPFITWDGTGAEPGPGIYFFRVKVGNRQAAGKVVKLN
jgi:hypothetical protein